MPRHPYREEAVTTESPHWDRAEELECGFQSVCRVIHHLNLNSKDGGDGVHLQIT
jgi:hypothetical protein